MANRGMDDFPARTKQALANRVAHACSICKARTIGPSDRDESGVNNVGVAAHISGVKPSAARYDSSITAEERRSICNGIWLCQSCGKKVDGDHTTWSVAELVRRKVDAEERAKDAIGRRAHDPGRLFVQAEACVFVHHFRGAFIRLRIVNERRRGISIQDACLKLDGVDHRPSIQPVSFVVGCPWLAPPPLRLDASDAVYGAWFFGHSFMGLGDEVVAGPDSTAELLVVPVGRPSIRTKLDFVYPPKQANGEGS